MKPVVLFSGKVHLIPEITTELILPDMEGLNSITLDLSYMPIFDNRTIYAELSDGQNSFKVVTIRLIGYPKASQKSLSFDSYILDFFTNPVKLNLVSEIEVFFNLKILGI